MATTTSDAKSGLDSNDDYEVLSKLAHEEFVEIVKELVGWYLDKSKALKTLQK